MHLINQAILDWHSQYGRSDLPWQNTRDHYAIWLSEIMLQQTQVATVIPYYQRFIKQYPNFAALADAKLDEILHLWTGLGYYARGRNLHKTATIIRDDFAGVFPSKFVQVLTLPGIGRSTAGAILAFAENQRYAILDGNVKRVLARFYAVEGWYGQSTVTKQLWQLAEQNTASKEIARYTQAIMDFGATLCTRSKPRCDLCPLQNNCLALKTDRVKELPHGKPKKSKPTKETYMLLIRNQRGEYLLQQNPPSGIWGGLWCPPQLSSLDINLLDAYQVSTGKCLKPIKHHFSHYSLLITPVETRPANKQQMVTEQANQIWYKSGSEQQLGLAAPVKKLLSQHAAQTH
jgi:A/G-specific adenine glycosylase